GEWRQWPLLARTRPPGRAALTSAFEGKSGPDMLTSSSSLYDPGCVKTHLVILFALYDSAAFWRRDRMRRFVEGIDRGQASLFAECREDWVDEDNPVRVIDAFVDKLDLSRVGFDGVAPEATGRPSYHPAVLLKLYIYGYLNRVQSSRRLEREAGRN